jgi:hypothetical protein
MKAAEDWADEMAEINKELARLRKENDILRGLLPRLGAPCVYCGLTNMGLCRYGFPGCGLADDLMVSEDETFKRLLDENRELKVRLKLNEHP